jgi:hypothetical protein
MRGRDQVAFEGLRRRRIGFLPQGEHPNGKGGAAAGWQRWVVGPYSGSDPIQRPWARKQTRGELIGRP